MISKYGNIYNIMDGLVTYGPEGLRITDLLEACFLSWAHGFQANPMRFPPVIRVEDLDRIGYFQSFPHLGVFLSGLRQESLGGAGWEGEKPELVAAVSLAPSSYAMPYAACYHVYLHFSGRVLDHSQVITTAAQCFRNEAHFEGLSRLFSFYLREIVCVGPVEAVREFLTRVKEELLGLADDLRLALQVCPATDPFYDRQAPAATLQRLFPVKEEFVYGDGLALASVNYHLGFFGERCDIRTADGQIAHSACVGMGLDRWVQALLDRFKGNATAVCDMLAHCRSRWRP